MIIHNVKIQNFKSLYGSHEFDFDKMKGLVKLSGPIGAGKTSIGEALIWGLYGNVKGQTNPGLVAWNCKACEVELNITSKDKNIHIIRNIREPLIVEVNGKTLNASNKKDTQAILEDELYDIPKLAVTKMCIISFNAFNSLASMNVGETKQFLDDIFGFKLFTDYNNEVIIERKTEQNESIRLQSVYDENLEQIDHLKQKQATQTIQLQESLNVNELQKNREELVNKGVETKNHKADLKKEREQKDAEYDLKIKEFQNKMTEAATLGKQAKNHYNTFKSGICPTCGQSIDQSHIDEYKNKMEEYARIYRENEAEKKKLEEEKQKVHESYHDPMIKCDEIMDDLRKKISAIDAELKSYNDSVQLLNDNYEELIKELENKSKALKEQINKCDLEIAEWNEMNELFSKSLRYNLLETLIPHIKYHILIVLFSSLLISLSKTIRLNMTKNLRLIFT